MQNKSNRYLGLELAGARNQKTSLAVLEYYPREEKTFLLEICDKIFDEDSSNDQRLLDVIQEHSEGGAKVLAVNVPMELPPCITCSRSVCPLPTHCSVPAVKWMREFEKAGKRKGGAKKRRRDITPYTQRPVELFLRQQVLSKISAHAQFEIDETLGGSKAPLTARMNFLKRHLKKANLIEVSPKLSIALLSERLSLHKRVISSYRKLEEGAHARSEILEMLGKEYGVFIYEKDLRRLSQSLAAFDAFVCAYTGLLFDIGRCVKPPRGFPEKTGWVHYPMTVNV